MRKGKIIIALILAAAILAPACTPNNTESSDVKSYEDYKTPEGENLDFGTITINGEPDKTRSISIKNPQDPQLGAEDIVYINDYDKEITVPEGAYAIKLENSHLNNYKVISVDIKNIPQKSGCYLIFTGEYNVEFAKTVYTEGKEIKINKLKEVSSIVNYPSVIIGDKAHRITGGRPNVDSGGDGVFLFDAAYENEYTQISTGQFVQIAVVGGRIVYIGEKNELISIPGANGFLLNFAGETAVGETANLHFNQEVKSYYLSITKGAAYTLKTSDINVGINNVNCRREAETTVLYTPEYRYSGTQTNAYGFEYTISGGVVTSITTPSDEGGGNAEIPEDGYVVSTLPDSSEFRRLKDLKIGDSVDIKQGRQGYEINTLPFNGYNITRQAEYVVIYSSKYGKNTRTNEWGTEILVDKNGKITSSDGDGNALIPDGGYVISGIGAPKLAMLKLYKPGTSVYVDDNKNLITFVHSPMDSYKNTLDRFALLKESAKAAYSALSDIDHNAVKSMIDEIEKIINGGDSATGADLENNRRTVLTKVKDLGNLLIPSLAVENRGAWHVLSEYSDKEVEHTVQMAASLGLNFIIIDAWGSGYTFYHTELDGVLVNPRFSEFDPLEAFIRIGHEYGLEIHASFSTFMAGGHNYDYPEKHPTQREGWLSLSKKGLDYCSSSDGEFYTLDPNNPEVRSYLISIFCEVAEKYDVDGIHYDYIRFPQPSPLTGDFGYNEGVVKAFQKAYRTTVNPADMTEASELWEQWCLFRCEIISSFVKECTVAVKKIDSEIYVTASVFVGIDEMKTSIFQDASSWAKGGYVDGIFSMMYTDSLDSFKKYGKRVLKATEGLVYCGIGLGTFEFYRNDIIQSEIEYVRENYATICFFTLDSIFNEQYKEFIANGFCKRKAVTTYSESSFTVAVEDLIRRIDEIYIPMTDGYDDKLEVIKSKLGEITADNVSDITAFAQENLSGVLFERISESLSFIEYLTTELGYHI
ncbi:MAG: family 10 glycosylhydrolase [Eubacteriales bacterium]|nr:family 10 glycosylhydrolase [Eubacteriales bacterium]